MRRTNLYLDEVQTSSLDELARAEGISRAAVVRRLVDRGIGAPADNLEADLAAIDESFGAGVDVQSWSRGPDERARHLDRIARA